MWQALQRWGVPLGGARLAGCCRARAGGCTSPDRPRRRLACLSPPTTPQHPHRLPPLQVTRRRGVPLHVDCCLGGFVLPFARQLGYPIPPFDFSVPGVTSISVDTHKVRCCCSVDWVGLQGAWWRCLFDRVRWPQGWPHWCAHPTRLAVEHGAGAQGFTAWHKCCSEHDIQPASSQPRPWLSLPTRRPAPFSPAVWHGSQGHERGSVPLRRNQVRWGQQCKLGRQAGCSGLVEVPLLMLAVCFTCRCA